MRRLRALLALAVLPLATGGCFVGLGCWREVRLRASTGSGFEVTPTTADAAVGVALFGDLGSDYGGPSDFGRVYDTLVGERPGERRNVVFTLVGFERPPADRITLSLSLPARLGAGDRFAVRRVFAVAADRPEERWRFRPAGEAEVAFTRSRASMPHPPYDHVAHFTATEAAGTVEVLRRDTREVALRVDLVVRDAAGGVYRVAGPLTLQMKDEGRRCFSPS